MTLLFSSAGRTGSSLRSLDFSELTNVGCGRDQDEGVKEAEGCCVERATENDYIHNHDE
jgi:hypothetical protein